MSIAGCFWRLRDFYQERDLFTHIYTSTEQIQQFEYVFSSTGEQMSRDLRVLYNDLHVNVPRTVINPDALNVLMDNIAATYWLNADKYIRLRELANINYNPLENYNMIEEGTDNTDSETTGSQSASKSATTSTTSEGTSDTTTSASASNSETITHNTTATTTTDMTEDVTEDTDNVTTYGKTDTTTHNTTDTTTHNTTDTTTYNITDTDDSTTTIDYERNLATSDNGTNTDSVAPYDSDTFANDRRVANSTNGTATGTETTETTIDGEKVRTGTEALARTGTEANARTGTDTVRGSGSDSTATDRTITTDTDGTVTETHTGTDGTSGTHTTSETVEVETSTETAGTYSDTVSGTTSGTESRETTHTLTRSGNIGVTTSQQMYQAEYDLTALKIIKRVFYDDLIKTVFLQIY